MSDRRLRTWRDFVVELERGYQWTEEEYANEIGSRLGLEELGVDAGELYALDLRFLAATEVAPALLYGMPEGLPPDFQQRIPKIRTPNF